MRLADDGTLGLSPSDLSAHLACPHLTTLSAACRARRDREAEAGVAASRPDLPQGERARGGVPRAARGRGPLDRPHPDLRRRGIRRRRGAAADRGGDPGRRGRRHLPAVPRQRGRTLARLRGLPRAAARRRLRAGRHEARASAQAGARAAALFYAEQVARIQGAPVERVHVENGRGERETFRVEEFEAYYRRVRERFLAALARRAGDVSVAVRPLRDLRLPSCSAGSSASTTTTSRSSRGCGARRPSG